MAGPQVGDELHVRPDEVRRVLEVTPGVPGQRVGWVVYETRRHGEAERAKCTTGAWLHWSRTALSVDDVHAKANAQTQ